jgi:hypothetical protein
VKKRRRDQHNARMMHGAVTVEQRNARMMHGAVVGEQRTRG